MHAEGICAAITLKFLLLARDSVKFENEFSDSKSNSKSKTSLADEEMSGLAMDLHDSSTKFKNISDSHLITNCFRLFGLKTSFPKEIRYNYCVNPNEKEYEVKALEIENYLKTEGSYYINLSSG